MTVTVANLRRKIEGAGDLQAVVRTMKAIAASSIVQYENSVLALADYYRTIELGLSVCFQNLSPGVVFSPPQEHSESRVVGAIVLGSDQGLVGRFNDVVAEHAIKVLKQLPGNLQVWAVGERVQPYLTDAGLQVLDLFPVATSVKGIRPLIGKFLFENETRLGLNDATELHLFYNRPVSGAAFEPVNQRLLPLDAAWHKNLMQREWPTKNLPEVLGGDTATLQTLIREYLFVSLFRACAESLASENASRLAAMQRAEKNIDELLDSLNSNFHRLRQSSIDEELFDVVSGFEALAPDTRKSRKQ